MPMYHFNIEDGQPTLTCDGAELKDIAEAKCEAIKMMGRLICDAPATFWDDAQWRMTVTNEDGLALFELCFVGTDSPAIRVPTAEQITAQDSIAQVS